jgi:HEAT repeat protein
MMKINKIIFAGLSLLMISVLSFSQDKRTIETKIADLLSQLPSNDLQYTDKLMEDMLFLEEEGIRQICDMIIPAGTGDDTKARFAVETFSRYLSGKGKETGKSMWEKICISYAIKQKDNGVIDFFIKQLQLIGGDQTAEALKGYLSDKDNCTSAISAITAIGGKTAEHILAESLKDKDLPCAAAVMNALASMKSKEAVSEYIYWTTVENTNTKASAYNALAMSGSPVAYPVLMKAARSYYYRWERTGATTALLDYANTAGLNGDLKTMDRICKLLIKKCNDRLTFQNKAAALRTYVTFHGINAMADILKASAHPDIKYRNAAINMSELLKGTEVVDKWIEYFPKALPEARPEILTMLGNRGDEKALDLLNASLNDTDSGVRVAAAEATAKISGKKAVPALTGYMMKHDAPSAQEAVKSALKTVLGKDEMPQLKQVLKDGSPAAKISAIELMAWGKGHEYFTEILPYSASSDEGVKAAAFKALANLTGPEDQEALIKLLQSTNNSVYISDIQQALSAAANKTADPRKRSSVILKAMDGKTDKKLLIPVIARTGGREALSAVLKEFENGDPAMREVCFRALTSWSDYSASSALYEICASGNKTYEAPAFDGYVRQIRAARITDEQKLLYFRKIMPFALSADRKNQVLTELGKLKTYQTLFFVAGYLDDPVVSATAAKSAMYIALPSVTSRAGMYGSNVREILNKVLSRISGQESEYDREMITKYLQAMPADEGFVSMFNGKDLTGWQGLVENPLARAKMKSAELAKKQAEADERVPLNWNVKDGCIWFSGKGENLCSMKEYGDFEMLTDWKISKGGDSGIYLRGTPQVQIWDTSRVSVGAQVGSGGLYNNQVNPSKPLKVADNQVGEWNTFRIVMVGEKVSVWLNGELVADNVTLENYWDRKIPIFPKGPIELQAHGTDLAFRDIYVREISEKEYNLTPEEKAEGFITLFNGRNLDNWVGNKESYVAEDGMIVIKPQKGSGGNLYTEKEYADFIFRFEFQLTAGANNGLGIRAPLTGDAAYVGMELQIIDNKAPEYAKLQPYQYHGSVYGVIPAKRDYLKPVGEWNYQEVVVTGTQMKVILNGTTIVDGDIAGPRDNGTMDHRDHPGLKNKTGHIGFLGHGSLVKFRNIRIKDLSE